MLCLLYLRVLPLSKRGGGVRRFSVEEIIHCMRLTPLPTCLHPSESEVVYNGFRPDRRQAPKDMQKAIPSL